MSVLGFDIRTIDPQKSSRRVCVNRSSPQVILLLPCSTAAPAPLQPQPPAQAPVTVDNETGALDDQFAGSPIPQTPAVDTGHCWPRRASLLAAALLRHLQLFLHRSSNGWRDQR